MITARVHGKMTKRAWIDLLVDGRYVASIVGKAKVKYTHGFETSNGPALSYLSVGLGFAW